MIRLIVDGALSGWGVVALGVVCTAVLILAGCAVAIIGSVCVRAIRDHRAAGAPHGAGQSWASPSRRPTPPRQRAGKVGTTMVPEEISGQGEGIPHETASADRAFESPRCLYRPGRHSEPRAAGAGPSAPLVRDGLDGTSRGGAARPPRKGPRP